MEAIVQYNYEAREPDELTLQKGDIIKQITTSFGGWWEGTLRDKRGMFPDNFVKLLEGSGSPGNKVEGAGVVSTTDDDEKEQVVLRNGSSARRYCKVLFSYEPCNKDELKLVPQDLIEFLEEVEEGWYRGRHQGTIGVFPSNFVTFPSAETAPRKDKQQEVDDDERVEGEEDDQQKPVYCKVLFSYEAVNEDELSLKEGDIVTLISKDAPDIGWWRGQIRDRVGLFPDNFVEIMSTKSPEPESKHESLLSKTNMKLVQGFKQKEKAFARKSLGDTKGFNPAAGPKRTTTIGVASGSNVEKKKQETPPSTSTREMYSLVSNLRRNLVTIDNSGGNNNNIHKSNNNNGSSNKVLPKLVAPSSLELLDELDEVERGEGMPLAHLTATRAKAPRRRLPTTHHLRLQSNVSTITSTTAPLTTSTNTTHAHHVGSATSLTNMEERMTNGNSDSSGGIVINSRVQDEGDGVVPGKSPGVTVKPPPWVEELKLNQRRKNFERVESVDAAKDRASHRLSSGGVMKKLESEIGNETKGKDVKSQPSVTPTQHTAVTPSSTSPATMEFVPYHLYVELLERVTFLEENQKSLQRQLNQLDSGPLNQSGRKSQP